MFSSQEALRGQAVRVYPDPTLLPGGPRHVLSASLQAEASQSRELTAGRRGQPCSRRREVSCFIDTEVVVFPLLVVHLYVVLLTVSLHWTVCSPKEESGGPLISLYFHCWAGWPHQACGSHFSSGWYVLCPQEICGVENKPAFENIEVPGMWNSDSESRLSGIHVSLE